jgi:hypothetical protein
MTLTNPAVAMLAWFAAGLLSGMFAAVPLVLATRRASLRGGSRPARSATPRSPSAARRLTCSAR